MIDALRRLGLAYALCATTASALTTNAVGFVRRPDASTKASGQWGRIVVGRLSNGLRFAILPRTSTEPGVGLLMRNEGGFIAERRPGERGLTHLIEHLMFVSPTRQAPDDLRHFVRVGLPLTFPAPSAGTTTWRETNYFVSTRTTQTRDLSVLLGLLREGATDLTFRDDAVDDQRADVMREMAGRKAGNEIYARYIGAVAPGSPTDVIDGQNSDDVPTAGIETIRGLYHRLYRPENTMVVVVGNVNPTNIERLIQDRFGSWKGPAPTPVAGSVPSFQARRIGPLSYSDAADGRRVAMITVTSKLPTPTGDRREQVQATLMEMLVTRAINNRLTDGQPGAARGKTGIYIENGEQGHGLVMLWDNFGDEGWRAGIAGLWRSSCAFETGGFSDREWTRAKQDTVRDLKARVSAMPSVPNVELAKDLSHALAAGRDLIPPDELLGFARHYLQAISAKNGAAWWRHHWRTGIKHVRVEAPELTKSQQSFTDIRNVLNETVSTNICSLRTD